MSSISVRICCREIGVTDVDDIVSLLARGFRTRTRDFWVRALKRLSEHPTPVGYPKYGYLLESKSAPVGVILLIYSAIVENGETRIRCNVSSWYVEPRFRSYAGMLISRALKHKHVTYFNITPNRHTFGMLEAQGYTRYCSGRFAAVPALSAWSGGAYVSPIAPDIRADEGLPSDAIELLSKHANYGCISLTCSTANRRHPFVFLPRRKAGVVPFAYLAYCHHIRDFVRFAGPLGRFLVKRGFPLVVTDANGPMGGLIGKYSDGAPKYFKGPDQPRLGDM